MAANNDAEALNETRTSPEDRQVGTFQRPRPHHGEDAGFGRDRDRSRQPVTQVRPTLSAVGRVASRVRTSGISKISTLLQNGKEEEGINASPWGVGQAAISKAAMARSQSTSVIAKRLTKSTSTMRIKTPLERSESTAQITSPLTKSGSVMYMKSPGGKGSKAVRSADPIVRSESATRGVHSKGKDTSDVLEMSSPMSTDHAETSAVDLGHARLPIDDASSGSRPRQGQEGLTAAGTRATKSAPTGVRRKLSDMGRTPTPESPINRLAAKRGEGRPRPKEPGKMLERLGSTTVKSKFHFRPSLLIESQSPGCRKEKDDAFNGALEKDEGKVSEQSSAELPGVQEGQNRKDGTVERRNLSNRAPHSPQPQQKSSGNTSTALEPSHEVDSELELMDSLAIGDAERPSIFSFMASRSKIWPEIQARKHKTERQRGIMGLSRSRSQAPKPPTAAEVAPKEDVDLTAPRKFSSNRSTGRSGKAAPPPERVTPAAKHKKVGWFNLRKSENGPERGGGIKGRSKSRKVGAGKEQDKAGDGEVQAPKHLPRRRDEPSQGTKAGLFGRRSLVGGGPRPGTLREDASGDNDGAERDDAIHSSEDEGEASAVKVRSLAHDDFISYQTKQGRKGRAKA